MFNDRLTIIPEVKWHEAEPGKFYMRTADDHARVYKAVGGPAAGNWRAIFNDAGLTTGDACDGSAFTTEHAAKNAVRKAYEAAVHKRVLKAREVMTFYTAGNSNKQAITDFARALRHKWEHHGLEAFNKMLKDAEQG